MAVHPPLAGLLPGWLVRAAGGCAVLVATALTGGRAAAADLDVGVSIGIHHPGVYGRIDIGRYPAPVLVSPRPVVVVPPVVVHAPPQPVALWVPPAHRHHWRKHCHRYGACGLPVVFVHDGWAHEHGPGYRPRRDEHWDRDDHRGGDHRGGWERRRDGYGAWPAQEHPRRWDRGDRHERDDRWDRRRGKDRDD